MNNSAKQARTPTSASPRMPLTILLLLVLGAAATSVTAAERTPAHGPSSPAPAVEDTSVMTGSGLNTLGGPITKKTPEGLFLKEPGSRTWTLFRPPTLAERRAQREQERQESVARRGHLPMDLVIGVDDTTIATRLHELADGLARSLLPCRHSCRSGWPHGCAGRC